MISLEIRHEIARRLEAAKLRWGDRPCDLRYCTTFAAGLYAMGDTVVWRCAKHGFASDRQMKLIYALHGGPLSEDALDDNNAYPPAVSKAMKVLIETRNALYGPSTVSSHYLNQLKGDQRV